MVISDNFNENHCFVTAGKKNSIHIHGEIDNVINSILKFYIVMICCTKNAVP